MAYENVLQAIICDTFEQTPGRHKANQAMLITFKLTLDYDKEEGYRYLDLLIWAPTNYVKVYTRERWNVISLDDLEPDGDDSAPKKGKGYTEGGTEWKRRSDHDSGWRMDGIQRTLNEYYNRISVLDNLSGWYKIVDGEWLKANFPKEHQRYVWP